MKDILAGKGNQSRTAQQAAPNQCNPTGLVFFLYGSYNYARQEGTSVYVHCKKEMVDSANLHPAADANDLRFKWLHSAQQPRDWLDEPEAHPAGSVVACFPPPSSLCQLNNMKASSTDFLYANHLTRIPTSLH
jgi:hypothetical protein